MRISDWSSDVCSSDLPVAQGQRVIVVDVADHGYALIADEIEDVCFIEALETRIAGKLSPGWEIGRASCRERVCQYVSISVFAESLETKTTNINILKLEPESY